MNDLEFKEILHKIVIKYYVIDSNTYKILESNNPKIKKGETFCYEFIHGYNKPCDNLKLNMKCVCKEVLKQKGKVELIQKIDSKNGLKIHKVVAKPLINSDNKISYILAQYIDISDDFNLINDDLKRYRHLTENAKDMIYRMSLPEGKYEFVSFASKRIFGYSPEEFYSNPVLIKKTLHPDWHKYFKREWKRLNKGIVPPFYEYQIIAKSGEVKWINQRNLLIKDESGKPVAIEGIVTDNTESKKAELALRESEQKLRNIFENSTNLFYQHTVDHKLTYLSPQVKVILGYSVDEALKKWTEFLTDNPINIEGVNKTEKALKTGKSQPPFEMELKHKSGRKVWVEVREAPVIKNGKAIAIVGALTDITERKIAENALNESAIRFKTYIASSPIAIFIVNEKGQYEYGNKAVSRLLGYTLNDIYKMSISDVKMVSGDEHVMADFNEVKKTGILMGKEVKYKKKNGDLIDVMIDAVKLSNNQYIAYCTDISEIKNYQHKLKEKNEEYYALNEELEENIERIQFINTELQISKEKAEESDRLKSAFLANMSHEIRTPLNGILGFASLLKKDDLTNENVLRYATIIENSGNRLLSVVNDVFDISLIQTDQIKIEKKSFEINTLLDELYMFYQTVQKDKIQNINFKLVKNSAIEINILNDQYRLHQILKNLINNAFKFTLKGEIEYGYLPLESNEITFYVKDTGIGIPDEHKNAIFSAFRQVDESISRDYEGAGLGLSICSGLIERMKGKIWVESKTDKLSNGKQSGSVFYFTLPLDEKESNNEVFEIDS